MLGSLVSSGLGSILGSANSLAKTVFGDKAAKEAGIHQEQMELQKGYQAEFLAPEKKGWFNQLVDGANRLVRPLFTYGIVALFIWACVDPVEFTMTVQALGVIPELLWYIMMTIIGFWFGGRILEKAPMRVSKKEMTAAKTVAKEIAEERDLWEDKYEQVDKDIPKTSTNKVVAEWQKKSIKKTSTKSSTKPKPAAKKFLGMTVKEVDEDEFQDER
jgi:hypothetical protein